MAIFSVTKGRLRATAGSQVRSSARPSSSRTPVTTSIPAARRVSAPPAATGLGSGTATTTRATPASMSARAHGPVRPVWLQGSSVTTAVHPRTSTPAARAASSAATSACGVPTPACHPSARTAGWAASAGLVPELGLSWCLSWCRGRARRAGRSRRAGWARGGGRDGPAPAHGPSRRAPPDRRARPGGVRPGRPLRRVPWGRGARRRGPAARCSARPLTSGRQARSGVDDGGSGADAGHPPRRVRRRPGPPPRTSSHPDFDRRSWSSTRSTGVRLRVEVDARVADYDRRLGFSPTPEHVCVRRRSCHRGRGGPVRRPTLRACPGRPSAGRAAQTATGSERPPVRATSSSCVVAKTACGCPAAAQTTGYARSASSTTVGSGSGWPTGATPPIG